MLVANNFINETENSLRT